MQTIPIGIGTTVDFIFDKARHRGVIHGIKDGMACIPVVGDGSMFLINLNHVVPVKHHNEFVALLRD